MAQVILIESNKTLNDLISINLTTYLGVDLIHRHNAVDTINLLSILPTVDLIVTNQAVRNEPTAQLIENYIIANKLNTNLIVLGSNAKSFDNVLHISDPKNWEQVVKITAKILGINDSVIARRILPDYVPIPVRYFLNLDNVNCDVFIRIKKSPTEYQYIKRIHNGDNFSKDSIHRYIQQGLDDLYIPKDAKNNFATYLSNQLVNKMENPHLEINQKIQIMGESYDIAVREVLKLGFTSETIQLTEVIIQNMVKNFEKSPEMSGLLHKLINSDTGLLFQRSHMNSVVASEMVKNLKIKDDKAFEKIAYASFFHDIFLTDDEFLSKINSNEELEQAALPDKEWDKVFNHALDAANLLRKHPEAPTGSDEIIKNHHGASNGNGFSNSIDTLPMLSKIFIIAHNFVLELIRFKELGGEPKPITDELFKRYPGPEMFLLIKSLENTLKKKNF